MADFTELLEYVKRGDNDSLKQQLADDADAARLRDDNGVSLILHALYNRQGEVAQLLKGHAGELDIFEAAALGDTLQLQELLDENAGVVNTHAGDGFTPLQLACYFRQPAATKLLLESGADAEAVGKNGMALRAIHAAASSGDIESLKALIEHGAEVNSTQHGGYTALMAAAGNGNREMIELLLEHGANAAATNDEGQTAADIAEVRLKDEVRALLEEQKGE